MKHEHEFFRKNGYAVIKNALDTSLIQQGVQEIFTLFSQQLDYLGIPTPTEVNKATLHEVMRTLLSRDVERYKSCIQIAIHLRPFYQLLASEGIFEVLKTFGITTAIVPSHGILHMLANDLRIPGGYLESVPHQDWMSMHGSVDGVTIWAPLLPMDESSSPLQLVPKSHRHGLLPSTKAAHYEVNKECYEESDFISLRGNPGDVVVMHCFTLHRSGRATEDSLRAAISFRYSNMEDPSYVRRSYPNGYKRIVDYDRLEQKLLTKEEIEAHSAYASAD